MGKKSKEEFGGAPRTRGFCKNSKRRKSPNKNKPSGKERGGKRKKCIEIKPRLRAYTGKTRGFLSNQGTEVFPQGELFRPG